MTDGSARHVAIAGSVVRSRHPNAEPFTAARMFAVVVLWDAKLGEWLGWLTTIDHESMCFGPADLADAEFAQWLACLPNWEPWRMTNAITTFGLHAVWRQPFE